ncbi:hypothetical protein Vretimale_8125 [Volvox reticuliferus]|uniref:Uncharacterized protein n=1 Tax=Volvox reticuliferus TaxID=1737510 RepID=A0A8J4C4R7_9CHLO|nr:hypothetical protein Vretifemale_5270 [Volvox reticuliferus]GIM03370.1 hypothetical protein Vretimale_8125 [Volvox reticuliferus]
MDDLAGGHIAGCTDTRTDGGALDLKAGPGPLATAAANYVAPAAATDEDLIITAAAAPAAATAAATVAAPASRPLSSAGHQLPEPPASPCPVITITGYQLLLTVHEASYQRECGDDADLADFRYDPPEVDRIQVVVPPPTQQLSWHVQQQPQQGSFWRRRNNNPGELTWRQQGQQRQDRQGRRGPAGRGGSSETAAAGIQVVGVMDSWLAVSEVRNYKITLDRRLRPVMLACHAYERCPLPLLGLGQLGKAAGVRRHGHPRGCTAGVGNTNAAAIAAAVGGGEASRRDQGVVVELQRAIQRTIDVIFEKGLMKLPGEAISPSAGGGGLPPPPPLLSQPPPLPPPPPPPPLLVIHANEEKWRDSAVIHLKIPIGGTAEYVRLLRDQFFPHDGAILANHDNQEARLVQVLDDHYKHMTFIYSSPYMAPFISNFVQLPDAQQLLDSNPGLFLRIRNLNGNNSNNNTAAETAAAAAGVAASTSSVIGSSTVVLYGNRKLPCLMATLPGRSVNGLSLEEALDCMKYIWDSDLRQRLFKASEGWTADKASGVAGLRWTLVPCFAWRV